jgi:hypothetical protein
MKDDDGSFSRIALCVCASLYTFVFIGALFGFGPMQRMLEDSGAFSYLCHQEGQEEACPAQSQTIVNLGLMGTTLSIATPFVGAGIDQYGAAAVSYGMSACGMLGSALMVVAAFTNTSWLYWIVFCLLGLTTFSGSLLSVQVGLFFLGHTQVRIIMWLNALFDAGSASYLLLWMIQEYTETDFVLVAMIYFGLAIALFLPACYFWTIATPQEEHFQAHDGGGESESLNAQQHDKQMDDSKASGGSVTESLRYFMESHFDPSLLSSVVQSRSGSLRPSSGASLRASYARDLGGLPSDIMYGTIREDQTPQDDEERLLAERSAKGQLLSAPFLSLTFFFAVSQISCTWSLMTAADFLATLGDDGWYLKLFTLMQPISILFLPLVDSIVRVYGFGFAFQGVNLINFSYILIKCCSKNLNLQIVTFLCVAAVRCFLYATTFSYLPSLLSADVVGRGTGFLCCVGGISMFINIPFNMMAESGDFLTPNLIYLVAVLPCTIATCNVQKTMRREYEIKEARSKGAPVCVSKM